MHLFKSYYEPANTRMLRGLLRNVFKIIFSDVQANGHTTSYIACGQIFFFLRADRERAWSTSDLHHAICKNELNVPIVHVFTCRKVDTFLFFSRKKCCCRSSKFNWDPGWRWGEGGHSREVWVELCRQGLQNLFKTNIAHFATLFKTGDTTFWPWLVLFWISD